MQTAHNTKDQIPASHRHLQVTHTQSKQIISQLEGQQKQAHSPACWDILSGSSRVAKTVCDVSYVGHYKGRTESMPDTKEVTELNTSLYPGKGMKKELCGDTW